MRVETSKGDLPVHFGMNALALFGDLTDRSMSEVMASLANASDLKVSELLALFYAGFACGAKKEDEECKVNDPGDVGEMLDEDMGLIGKIMSVYGDQATPEDGIEEADGKKK